MTACFFGYGQDSNAFDADISNFKSDNIFEEDSLSRTNLNENRGYVISDDSPPSPIDGYIALLLISGGCIIMIYRNRFISSF